MDTGHPDIVTVKSRRGERQRTYLKFFEREVGSGLVIGHVVVPGLAKLEELRLLSRLNVLQFLFLGCADIVPLSLCLLLQKLVELCSRTSGLCIVALLFALTAIFFEEAEEVEDFAVGGDVDHASRAPFALHHHLLLGHHLLHLVLLLLGSLPSWITRVLHDFVFDLLHELEELVEGDAAIRVGVETIDEFADFGSVALQTAHDGLQVGHLNRSRLVRIEHLKDALQVVDLVLSKVVQILLAFLELLLLLEMLRLLLIGHLDRLLAWHRVRSREFRPLVEHDFVLAFVFLLVVTGSCSVLVLPSILVLLPIGVILILSRLVDLVCVVLCVVINL